MKQSSGAPQQTSSLGCLGVFSVFCLTLFTVGELALLLWLNPYWVERHAWWRAPLVEQEVAYAYDQVDQLDPQRLSFATTAPGPRLHGPATAPVLFELGSDRADYTLQGGARLQDKLVGGEVIIPPGAVREHALVKLTPISKVPPRMASAFVGPVYDLRIGPHEHYQFERPVEFRFPYSPERAAGGNPVVAVWEGDRWKPLPTRVDAANKVLIASTPHASEAGSIDTASTRAESSTLDWITGAIGNSLRSSIFRVTAYAGISNYNTPEGNFAVHYYPASGDSFGNHKLDQQFEQGVPAGDTPRFVKLVGESLEYSLQRLGELGLNAPTAKLTRYDVYLVDLGEGVLGQSPLGGPLYINCQLPSMALRDGTDPEMDVRTTCAHELTHLLQGAYYGSLAVKTDGESIKFIAEAVAEVAAQMVYPSSNAEVHLLTLEYGRLLTVPWNKTDDPYAYAAFPKWMQMHDDSGWPFSLKAMELSAGEGVGVNPLQDCDDAFRAAAPNSQLKTLGQAFTRFAAWFYHEDQWEGLLTRMHGPAVTAKDQAFSQASIALDSVQQNIALWFQNVARPSNQSPPAIIRRDYGEDALGMLAPLTAHAQYINACPLPKTLKPKLVVWFEPRGTPAADLRVYVMEGVADHHATPQRNGELGMPLRGNAGTVSRIELQPQPVGHVIEDFGLPGKPNRITLLFVNQSLSAAIPGVSVRRWLLVPPPVARVDRDERSGPQNWTVSWDHVGIHPSSQQAATLKIQPRAFKHYNVYRKRWDDPPSAWQVIGTTAADTWSEAAPDPGPWTYTVSVVDILDQESAKATVETHDPFIGTWKGMVAMTAGAPADALAAMMSEGRRRARAEMEQNLAAATTDQERHSIKQSWELDEKLAQHVMQAVNGVAPVVQQTLRLGVPFRVEVDRRGGVYYAKLTEVFWGLTPLPEEFKVDVAMKRSMPNKLVFRDFTQTIEHRELVENAVFRLEPPAFVLYRLDPSGTKNNVIRQESYEITLESMGHDAGTQLRWVLERESPEVGKTLSPVGP